MLKINDRYIPNDPYLLPRWRWRPGKALNLIGLLTFLVMMFLMGIEIGVYLQ